MEWSQDLPQLDGVELDFFCNSIANMEQDIDTYTCGMRPYTNLEG